MLSSVNYPGDSAESESRTTDQASKSDGLIIRGSKKSTRQSAFGTRQKLTAFFAHTAFLLTCKVLPHFIHLDHCHPSLRTEIVGGFRDLVLRSGGPAVRNVPPEKSRSPRPQQQILELG